MRPAGRRWGWYALFALLIALRLPSLAQPAGADQGLYAYVGTRILQGELPYRDAWDQKPPAIHFTYALLYAVWPSDPVIAAADLAAALAIAAMLVPLGRTLTGAAWAGYVAAALFLLLGDPSFSRLAGVRVRSQCETFVAAAMTGAILLALTGRGDDDGTPRRVRAAFAAGLCGGLAAAFKYNAVVTAPVALAVLWLGARNAGGFLREAMWFAAGAIVPFAAMFAVFGVRGALGDLYQATVLYNLNYSGETYSGPLSTVVYLLTFPIGQARIDALWTLGGAGCLVLIGHNLRAETDRRTLVPVAWTCAACLSIAINGSRGLPQYFVQAAPALALAAGTGVWVLWSMPRVPARLRLGLRTALVLIAGVAAWRVNDFGKLPRNAAHDLSYWTARRSRDDHLARYGGQREDKYAALSVVRLGEYLAARTAAADRIYIFGFSPGAYVHAGRASASRFFWSWPVIAGFNESRPGYGADGVLEDLQARPPRYVVLQRHDWAPPPGDSASFFLGHPRLGAWLRRHYERAQGPDDEDYEVWVRVGE